MAKIKVTCPECGHTHTIKHWGSRGQVAGVRTKRITGNQFEHIIDLPGEIIEHDLYYSIGQQLHAAGVVGASFGVVGGFVVGQIVYSLTGFDVTIEAPIVGAVAGVLYMWRFVYLERMWQWFERIPQAVQVYLDLTKATRQDEGGPTLTIDHRHRDGTTEAGRTIQYFGVLPVEVERFNEWGRAALRGDSLAIAQWTGQGKLFSRPEYDRLLDLLRRGGAVVNVPGKGNQLTGGGRRALTRHLNQKDGHALKGANYGRA